MAQKSRFFDGETADPYELDTVISKETLIGKTLSEQIFLQWKINDIRVVEEPKNGRAAIITSQTDNAARLYVAESIFQELEPLLSKEAKPVFRISTSAKSICFWSVISVLVVFLVFQSVPILAPYMAKKFPQEWEESLGNYAFNLLAGKKKTCTSADGLQSLQKILSALNLQESVSFEMLVVEDTSINAFAAPGGKIILYSGLIQNAESPAEVAGVIAHEMGHILEKHSTEALIRSLGLGLIAQLMFGNVGDVGGLGIAGQTLLELNYSRNFEREADKIALEILEESGIDSRGLRDFFDRVQKENPDMSLDFLTYLSTHPQTSERINFISEQEKTRAYQPIISEGEWEALKNICSD